MIWSPRVMIADDIPANVRLLRAILKGAGYENASTVVDGAAVLSTFEAEKPDILLLDLHMPNMDGLTLIREIRTRTAAETWTPIIVLTGDASVDARRDTLAAGASDFIGKPYDTMEVVLRVQNLLETRRLHLALARENASLEQRVVERTNDLLRARLDGLQRLATATETRDDDTGEHTRRVGVLAAELARRLGEPEELVELLWNAAPLHDIGKIAIPDNILKKPGRLTPDEYAIMKTHTTLGAAILTGGDHHLIRTAERIAATHHEHWNGNGYPAGLRGDDIPIEGRITAVADFYDALVHKRVYRAAFAPAEALELIVQGSGSQFDPRVVTAMLELAAPPSQVTI